MARDEADWFLKADDDSYIIIENLKAFLQQHSPLDPVQFGCKLIQIVKKGYMSGGAGYVLSREALKRFVTIGLVRSCKDVNNVFIQIILSSITLAETVLTGTGRKFIFKCPDIC